MTPNGKPEKLRGILYKDGDQWVAVCLDRYLVTFAPSKEEIGPAIDRMITAHIVASLENGQLPFKELRRAPDKYWSMLERSEPRETIEPPPGLYLDSYPRLELAEAV